MAGNTRKVNVTTEMNTPTDDLMRELKGKLGAGLYVEVVFQDGNATLMATGAKIGTEEVTARGKTLTVCVSKAVEAVDKIIAALPERKRGRPRKNPEQVLTAPTSPRKTVKRSPSVNRTAPRKPALVSKKGATRRAAR